MEMTGNIDQFLEEETEEEKQERLSNMNKPEKVYYFNTKKENLDYFDKFLLKTYPHKYKLFDPAITKAKMAKRKEKQKRKEIKKLVKKYGEEFNKEEITVEDRLRIKEIEENRAFWKEVEEAQKKPSKYKKRRDKREKMILEFFNKKQKQRDPKKYKREDKIEKKWKKILNKNPKMLSYYKEYKEDKQWLEWCDDLLHEIDGTNKYGVGRRRRRSKNPLNIFKPKYNGGDYDPTDDMVRRNALLQALDEVIMEGLRDPLHPEIAVDFKPNNIFTEYVDYATEKNLKKELKKQKKQEKSKLGKSKRDKKTKRLDIDSIII